jgi:hypothetical protein
MITKLLLALLVILNIYILAAINKTSRQDIGNNLKQIPSRIKSLALRVRHDDKEPEMAEVLSGTKTGKMDFSGQCKEGGVKCDGGMKCWHEVKPQRYVCMKCECSLCVYGVCPPAQKG